MTDAPTFAKLVDKLTPTARAGLEAAVAYCSARTHYNVEIEHWLLKLMDSVDIDLTRLLRYYEVKTEDLRQSLHNQLDRVKSGSSRSPGFSSDLIHLMEQAWNEASLHLDARQIGSGHLLFGLLEEGRRNVPAELARVRIEVLRREYRDIVEGGSESGSEVRGEGGAARAEEAPEEDVDESAGPLVRFSIDLTAAARAGKLEHAIGRESEIRQLVDVLLRRKQNNPLLAGEAGVGKTAIVEGLAMRVAAGEVPDPLKNVVIRTLDLALLQAGAGVRGEFESRLKGVIDEVKKSRVPIILFIDEVHGIVGAGGAAGQGDAANLLKPALARGELRTIGATTWAEYKKYFEKDAALARRFQVIKIDEPDEERCISILRGLAPRLESHHGVVITEEALVEAARSSERYLTERQLPDKAISVLDTACAKTAMSRATEPPQLENLRREIVLSETALVRLRQEETYGYDHRQTRHDLEVRLAGLRASAASLEARWQEEVELVRRLDEITLASLPDSSAGDVEAPSPNGERKHSDPELIGKLRVDLQRRQGDEPLVRWQVDRCTVAGVVSDWTGIPLSRVLMSQSGVFLGLEEGLRARIIGQDYAVREIARRLVTARSGLSDPKKPLGVFLLDGPSGVGKTETAYALAELLFGGAHALTCISMSEFKEEHKVSLLVGSPPGYVGYGEGGVLTEAVRRRPFSVVLLDEVEKAHPGVQDVFLQMFDRGILRDGEGRDVDFRNSVIVLTSNAGSAIVNGLCSDPDTRPDGSALANAVEESHLESGIFKAPFLGRVNLIPYLPLDESRIRLICRQKLDAVARRLHDVHRASLVYDDSVLSALASRCASSPLGARLLDRLIDLEVATPLSKALLSIPDPTSAPPTFNLSLRDSALHLT